MAKKKKKGRGKKAVKPVPKAQDFAALLDEQKRALLELRGRRASTLGERIFADESVDESVRFRALAVGHEAYLRELLSKGHTEQTRGKAGKLLRDDPNLAEHWALSLQLRFGLVEPQLEDSAWMARLRRELVDPEDLLGVDGLSAEAKVILDAWSLVETGAEKDVQERLMSVGRRSPLVDWRLFLQVLMATRRGDSAAAEAAAARMLSGTPAHCAAEKLLNERTDASGPVFRRLKALEARLERGRLKSADYATLQSLVQWLLKMNRPGLAGTLVVIFADQITSQQGANRYWSLFDRMTTQEFSLGRMYLRQATVDFPSDSLLHPDMMKELRRISWSTSELECVWLEFFRQARNRWDEMELDLYASELTVARQDLLVPLLDDCRRLVRKLPQCREVYDFWVWLEEKCEVSGGEALTAYAAAFDDPEVLHHLVALFARVGDFEGAQACLKRLPESDEKKANEGQSLLVFRMTNAFTAGAMKEAKALADEFSGTKLFDRIAVAFVRWRTALRGEKRGFGQVLVDFDLPWLVFWVGRGVDPTLSISKLPAGLRRSLDAPEPVLRSYLTLLEKDERVALMLNTPDMLGLLCRAADHPEAPIALLRPFLETVLLRSVEPEDYVWISTDGFASAFKTLLSGEPDDQALAIALRVLTVHLDDWDVDAGKTERSFRVAWTRAGESMRRVILRVYSKVGLERKNFPQKPATQKMIDTELKMQRRFRDLTQATERYVQSGPSFGDAAPMGGFDPFADLPDEDEPSVMDEVEVLIEGWEDQFEFQSKPFKFGRFPPTMELEFAGLINDIRDTTRGEHRRAAADRVEEMIQESTLSRKAKVRLMEDVMDLRKGA